MNCSITHLAVRLLLFFGFLSGLRAQSPDTWEQKADLGFNAPNGPGLRFSAVGFSIGSKGYIGTGYDAKGDLKNDFWEYDPASNSWTQKADCGGGMRISAIGFSIGSKGYIGTGFDENFNVKKDFWEYNPGSNSWTQKADFGGGGRVVAVGFSTSSKGYIGTGRDGSYAYKKDFWEYDPGTDSWVQKADFGGGGRAGAVGFNIGSKGYIGTGNNRIGTGNNIQYREEKDFWEYNPGTDSWTKKADFGGGGRAGAVGFNVGSKGYIGMGQDNNSVNKKDLWEYDPGTDSWVPKADFGGEAGNSVVGFGIGSKGYIGTGLYNTGKSNNFWEYDVVANSWTKKADLPGSAEIRQYAVGFSIGNKGYLGTGVDARDNVPKRDFWEYDPGSNSWTQKADFGGEGRFSAVGFRIGSKGYLGTGRDASNVKKKDFWEYDPVGNTWTKKADFGGNERSYAVGFSIGSKGYLGTGEDASYNIKSDLWEYDPVSDSWTQKADFGGGERYYAVGFSIGSKGYLGTGIGMGDSKSDFWEYNPEGNSWTQKADFGGGGRFSAAGFSIGSKGYLGTGFDENYNIKSDFWEYNPEGNSWTQKVDFGGGERFSSVGFSIGSKGYLGTGAYGFPNNRNDFWAYTSSCDSPTATISGGGTVCAGLLLPNISIALTGTAPWSVTYSNGTTLTTVNNITTSPYIITGARAGTYTVTAVSNASCTGTPTMGSATVTLNTKPTITLSINGQTLNEGSTQILCDTDLNPVNPLQLAVSSACVSGSPVWRVQVGNGAWSEWSTNAPTTQLSNNQAYRYQAACDAACASTYTSPISLTINYRASTPQNVSLVADGTTVLAGEEKSICDQVGNSLTFNATCATGERLLYSVDGGVYLPTVPTQMIDGTFHNYRVRCQKTDGTVSCFETESGLMRLKTSVINITPVASLNVTNGCGTPSDFSGTANCGNFTTVWYNAVTNAALPNLPTTTPNETTSYYARCQGETGCQSGVSNTVTFTVISVTNAPVITASADLVCTGTEVSLSVNCPTGSSVLWNTGLSGATLKVAFSNVTRQSYSARCVTASGCQSALSEAKTVSWKAFELTIINIGQSRSAIKTNDRTAWASQFVTADAGPILDKSTESNPTIYYSENVNKTGPRYWTIHVDACSLGESGSLTYDMLATPETGVVRSYNTHENNAPYFMYANRSGYTELYAQNHPVYGFYQDNGSGGNVYDEGLPKGLYKLVVRYWNQKGWGSIYPATRKPQGNVLALQEYWFRIQSKDGVGVGAARVASDNNLSSRRDLNPLTFAEVVPNPVSNILHLKVLETKAQKVNVSLLDASGRTLLQRNFVSETNTHQEEFNVSEIANGMYFLKVNAGDKQTTLKVIKVE